MNFETFVALVKDLEKNKQNPLYYADRALEFFLMQLIFYGLVTIFCRVSVKPKLLVALPYNIITFPLKVITFPAKIFSNLFQKKTVNGDQMMDLEEMILPKEEPTLVLEVGAEKPNYFSEVKFQKKLPKGKKKKETLEERE